MNKREAGKKGGKGEWKSRKTLNDVKEKTIKRDIIKRKGGKKKEVERVDKNRWKESEEGDRERTRKGEKEVSDDVLEKR